MRTPLSVWPAGLRGGRVPDRPTTVTTSPAGLAGLAGSIAPNQITLARGDSRMPAIPPAVQALRAGPARTPNRSS